MSHSDERIAALEAQLATLESRVTEGGNRPAAYDRRALLRRGGAVLAGAAGVMALPGMIDGASAAAGNNFVIGQANDAGAAQTTLTAASTSQAATLVVAGTNELNTAGTSSAAATSYGSPQLNLTPAVPYTDPTTSTLAGPFSPNPATTKTGDLFASTATTTGATAIASDLVYTHSGAFSTGSGSTAVAYSAVIGAVYTSAFHNVFVPVTNNNASGSTTLPVARVLDTRNSSVNTSVTTAAAPSQGTENPNATYGSSGVVPDNTVLRVKFFPGKSGGFLTAGGALYAVAGNITTASTTQTTAGNGIVAALPTAHSSDTGSAGPNGSSLNLINNINSNFAIIPVAAAVTGGAVQYYFFDLIIRSAKAAIIFDVTGLFVSDTTDVVLTAQPGYTASSASAKAQRARIAR